MANFIREKWVREFSDKDLEKLETSYLLPFLEETDIYWYAIPSICGGTTYWIYDNPEMASEHYSSGSTDRDALMDEFYRTYNNPWKNFVGAKQTAYVDMADTTEIICTVFTITFR